MLSLMTLGDNLSGKSRIHGNVREFDHFHPGKYYVSKLSKGLVREVLSDKVKIGTGIVLAGFLSAWRVVTQKLRLHTDIK